MIPGVLSFKTIPKLFMCGICKIPFEFCFILMVKHVFARDENATNLMPSAHRATDVRPQQPPTLPLTTHAHLTILTYTYTIDKTRLHVEICSKLYI